MRKAARHTKELKFKSLTVVYCNNQASFPSSILPLNLREINYYKSNTQLKNIKKNKEASQNCHPPFNRSKYFTVGVGQCTNEEPKKDLAQNSFCKDFQSQSTKFA